MPLARLLQIGSSSIDRLVCIALSEWLPGYSTIYRSMHRSTGVELEGTLIEFNALATFQCL